jgi:hypothetical protein
LSNWTTARGHIRNDTRGASRRIVDASLGAICRRKCAADDRACTCYFDEVAFVVDEIRGTTHIPRSPLLQ